MILINDSLKVIVEYIKIRSSAMINASYRKCSGMHTGQIFDVAGPYDEMRSPLRWTLHGVDDPGTTLIVPEDELNDPQKWQKVE